jgi:hypothetical protein
MRNQSSFHATGTPHGYCGHFPGRSFPVGFRPILPKPRPLQHKLSGHEKKSRIETPSGVKSPGKRRFMAFKTGQRCAHMRSKRWQMGARIACAVAAVGVRAAAGGGLFGVSSRDDRREVAYPTPATAFAASGRNRKPEIGWLHCALHLFIRMMSGHRPRRCGSL